MAPPVAAQAAAAISWAGSTGKIKKTVGRPNHHEGGYEQTVVDLSVKVLGGEVTAQRTYQYTRWIFSRPWADLEFVDADDETSEIPVEIKRNGFIYKLVDKAATPQRYVFDERQTIVRTADGHRWTDVEGNWIAYDARGKALEYGDRNDVKVRFSRNTAGNIERVFDHHNKEILSYTYDSAGHVIRVRDYSGRQVNYTWTNGDLTSVIDVRGNEWKYAYEVKLDAKRLVRIEEPQGRRIHINVVQLPAGQICTSGGGGGSEAEQTEEVFIDENGVAHVRTVGGNSGGGSGRSEGARQCFPAITQVLVESIKDQDGIGVSYRYLYVEKLAQYVQTEITAGNRVTATWLDNKGRAVQRTVNRQIVSRLVVNGNEEVAIDFDGFGTRILRDQWRNPLKIIHPDGKTQVTTYEPRYGQIHSHTDENGSVTRYDYDTRGNVTKLSRAAGLPEQRVTDYIYDAFGNRLSATQRGNASVPDATVTFAYDAYGNITSETDAEGGINKYTYDVMGNVLTQTDARGKTWTYTYDAAGNRTRELDPLGNVTAYEYDKAGNPVKITDAQNQVTAYEYNGQYRLNKVTDALGKVTTLDYAADGQVTKLTDADGTTARYEYDLAGRLVKTIDGNDNVTEIVYSPEPNVLVAAGFTRPAKIIFPTFREEYRYDKRGRLLSRSIIHDNQTQMVRYGYDAVGNQTSVTDPDGNSARYEYNGLSERVGMTDALNQVSRVSFDARGNVMSVIDGNSNTTRFVYDRNDALVSETQPLGQTQRWRYDPAGNLVEQTDAKGQVLRFSYDDAGRLTLAAYFRTADAETPEKQVTFRFDTLDRLVSYDDQTTRANYEYDAEGRKTKETVDYGSFSLSHSYSYTPGGAKKTFTGPDGVAVSYGYDTAGQLNTVALPVGAISTNEFRWFAPKKVTLPGGAVRRVELDGLLQPLDITVKGPADNTLMQYRYGFNPVGDIVSKATEHGNYRYAYDAVYRLTDVDYPSGAKGQYRYDAVDNRLSDSTVSGAWSYNGNNQLQSIGTFAFQYDANGSVVERNDGAGIRRLAYGIDQRLIQVTDESGATLLKSYYDPFGRRLWKEADGIRTYFAYSDEGLIGEYDGSGNQRAGYGYAPNAFWSTNPLYMTTGGEYYFYHNDHLGTPQKLTRIDGAVVWNAKMDAFGYTVVDTASTITNNLRFPGQYFDGETGLHYNYQRDYDPALGRYLQSDPIGMAGGINLYSYVYQNPLYYFDPTGEFVPAAAGAARGVAADYVSCVISCEAVNAASNATGECAIYEDSCFTSCLNPLEWFGFKGVLWGKGTSNVANSITPSTKQLEKFQKQLQEHGRKSLERSQRKIERRLNEHREDLQKYMEAGGPTSSVEREIRNFERELEAIRQTLGDGL